MILSEAFFVFDFELFWTIKRWNTVKIGKYFRNTGKFYTSLAVAKLLLFEPDLMLIGVVSITICTTLLHNGNYAMETST